MSNIIKIPSYTIRKYMKTFDSAAGTVYRFSRMILVNKNRWEIYMKHTYKVRSKKDGTSW